MFDFGAGLSAEIVPLSRLLGVWEGTGTPHVQYLSTSWVIDPDAETPSNVPRYSEIGHWRLSRPLGEADQGPGMLSVTGDDRLWAWDIAALGQNLRTHSSGRLARVE